jgi:hypothetical protein
MRTIWTNCWGLYCLNKQMVQQEKRVYKLSEGNSCSTESSIYRACQIPCIGSRASCMQGAETHTFHSYDNDGEVILVHYQFAEPNAHVELGFFEPHCGAYQQCHCCESKLHSRWQAFSCTGLWQERGNNIPSISRRDEGGEAWEHLGTPGS